MNPSGLRIGTPALTTRGLDGDDMREIAKVICIALSGDFEAEREALKARTKALADAHPLYPQLTRSNRLRIWVDCTAAAHPVVLRPVIELLRERGHEVSITARSYGQTEGLLDRLGLDYESLRHPRRRLDRRRRRWRSARRSAALARWARPRRFDLAIAHGSVDVAAVGSVLRIPQAQMQDYEFAGLQRKLSWRAASRVIVPDAIPIERLRGRRGPAGEAGPLPGPEGGLLPGRLRARRRGARRARPRPARHPGRPPGRPAGARRRPAAA